MDNRIPEEYGGLLMPPEIAKAFRKRLKEIEEYEAMTLEQREKWFWDKFGGKDGVIAIPYLGDGEELVIPELQFIG